MINKKKPQPKMAAVTMHPAREHHVTIKLPDGPRRPIAHMGYEGSRHLLPDRLPSGRREKTVGIRVIDLTPETITNIQRVAGTLRRLELSGLNLDTLSDEITNGLTQLQKINVNDNQLTENSFPDNFRELENLVELSAHGNCLTQMPKILRKLKNLYRLKLSKNQLSKLDGLDRMKRLQLLVLDSNNIDALSKEFFVNLKKLEILHCAYNRIASLPGEIKNLRNLRDLNLSDNNLSILPPEVFLLPRLEVLNASCNQISRIPTLNVKGQQKRKLGTIDLSENLLTRFPSHLMYMTDKLDLRGNLMKAIPLSLIDKLDQVPDLCLLLNENNFSVPPQDVCDCGLRAIIQFFMEVRSEMKIYQGLKILVLGAADQGKTSLVQTMVDEQARLTENESTLGVDLYEYSIAKDIEDPLGQHLNLSLFDFSGNPRYLFQHQFFMQQPALVLLVFNLATYDDASFKSNLGFWIEWVITQNNRIVLLPVGTHSDKLTAKKATSVIQKVTASISKHVADIKASIEREIKRIEKREYISPALSEQLKLYINLMKMETIVYDTVIPVSSKDFKGFSELEDNIVKIAETSDVFPSVLRVIPSLWGEVQNFIDDRGYAMNIPIMKWDEYVELVTTKFGMRHLIQAITSYLHDTGKVFWFNDHPTLKEFVFLRPSWLTDIFKAIFRHDFAEIDYTIEESFRQNNITLAKMDKMKKEIQEAGIIDRDYLKCLWSTTFKTEMNRPVLEVLTVLLEHFRIGYSVSSKSTRKSSSVSRTSTEEKLQKERLESVSTRSSLIRVELPTKSVSRAETASVMTTKSKKSEAQELTKDPPKITKIFIPWLAEARPKVGFSEEYQKYSTHQAVTAVFRFPKFIYPGLFETLSVAAQKNEYELHPLYHWKSGMYARHMQDQLRFYMQRIDHDDGGTCLRMEVRDEEPPDTEEKDIEKVWKLLLPFLKEAEDIISKFTGLRMERYMECPFCHSLSFLGEWRTPKETQGLPSKLCEICKTDVPSSFLVQPKEKRRVEEFLQKLLQEASRRRQEAEERESALLENSADSSAATDVQQNDATIERKKSPRSKKSSDSLSSDQDVTKDKPLRRKSSTHDDKTRVKHSASTSGTRSQDKGHVKADPHLATLKEEI